MSYTKCVHVCWILVGASTRKAFRGSVDWLALVVRWGRSFGQSWAWSARRFVFLLFLENKLLDCELWTDLNNGFHLWWRAMEVSTSFTTTKNVYVEHLQNTISHKNFQENYQVKYFLQDFLRHGSWLMLNFYTYLCDELLFQSSQESLTKKSLKTQGHWNETKLVLFKYILRALPIVLATGTHTIGVTRTDDHLHWGCLPSIGKNWSHKA